jgi:two-component system phosphate regulon response regulator PhoB
MSSELILVVEDDHDLLSCLEYNLDREGYRTRPACTGQEALTAVSRSPCPDLMLLDIMLPDISGIEVCRRIRASRGTARIPVIMVTAKTEEIDRVVGFEVGADDYVAKPVSIRELMLRIRAIMRRQHSVEVAESQFTCGGLQVDAQSHRVWVNDEEVILTALEFKLLLELLKRPGRVHNRGTLLERVWSADGDSTSRTVDTHVMRLRRKLGSMGNRIETLRGVGYRLREESG